jgi:hypothetical protein
MNELFTISIAVNLSLLLFGIITVFFILFESYYVKAFLALSSILNTVIIPNNSRERLTAILIVKSSFM